MADQDNNATLDEKITQKQPVQLATIDINVSVLPGHDMVINHVDGSQETAKGSIALQVMAKEAETGKVVDPSKVDDGVQAAASRGSDPEVNGPDQQVAGKTADAVVAASQADAPVAPTPAAPADTTSKAAPAETESASEDAAEGSEEASSGTPTSADVAGV